MNQKIFNFTYRVVFTFFLASVLTFGFVWIHPAAGESSGGGKSKSKTVSSEKMTEVATLLAENRGRPLINLRNGKKVETQFAGADVAAQMQPLTMTNADLNADGARDLIVGYANGAGEGYLALHTGSLDTLSARTPEIFEGMKEGRFPEPFQPGARLIKLPAAPDFIGTGDFNRDGWQDIIAARRGDNIAFLLLGGVKNQFEITYLELPGRVTAMLTDNIDPLDNAADIALAVAGDGGASLLVYKGAANVFGEAPDAYRLPAEATSLAIGQLDNADPMDILAAGNGSAVIIHGAYPQDTGAQSAQVEILFQGFDVAAARVGNFVWDRENIPEIALLDSNGSIRILERGGLDKRAFSEAEMKARRFRYREQMAEQEAIRQLDYQPRQPKVVWGKWTETDNIQLSAPLDANRAASTSFFTSARMTPLGVEDLLVLDSANRKLHILLSNTDDLKNSSESFAVSATGGRAAVTLDVEGAATAILPMRLSVMNRPGIVLLNENDGVSYALAAPEVTLTVNTTADTYDGVCSVAANGCSFRDALDDANQTPASDIIMLPAGTYTINPALGGADNDTSGDPAAQESGDWDVWYDTTIQGAGQATTILQAAAAQPGHDRVLDAIQFGIGIPDLTISGVTIQNGRCRVDLPIPMGAVNAACTDGGGLRYAVDNQSILTINDSTINNNRTEVNTASPANNGGGIFGGQSDFVYNNITVTNNIAAFVSSGCTGATLCGGEGGGVFSGIRFTANPTSVSITNSTITGNTVNAVNGLGGRGGAYAGSPDSVTVTGGTFNNNIAFTDAGGFRLFTPTTISGATISNNTARQSGGGIWSDPLANDNTPQTNTFSNVIMRGNTADSDGVIGPNNVVRGDGGAIFHGRGTLNLNNPTIGGTGAGEANTAFDGGGIARTYSQFTSAIFNASTLNINSGGSIVGNQAINNGGGIINNATKSAAAGNPSVLNMTGATAVTFTNNRSRNHGGGIAVITGAGSSGPAAAATLNNMTLRNNQANSDSSGGGDGGGLHNDSGGVSGGGTTFTGTLIIGGAGFGFANTAVSGGGIRNNAGTVTIPTGASITHNTATGTGGGISNNGTLSALTNLIITNNTATGNGGGIHNTGTLGTITNPTMTNNSAATGGGLFSSSGALTVTNGSVSTNTANLGKGGGIEHSGTSASTITSVAINNNTGSGVHITGTGSLDVKTSTITGNSGDGITKIGTGVGSHFDSNTVHSNGELGIDLSDNGVTPNDTNDGDTGPNNLQNFPVINYVRRGDGVANVTLNAPNGKYRIQYYKNAACDASGHGEGEILMTSQVVDVISGNTLTFFSSALAFDSGVREQITATATHDANGNNNFDDDGSTSEFSACRKVNTLPTITPQAGVTRQQGSPVSNSQIATVADPDQALNTLAVTVNGGASATVNGVTISGIAVDASGNVTANIVATCTATNASFTLRVTDNATEFNETTLNVTVTANTPPTLGTYPATIVASGSSGTVVTPNAAPTDNGTISTLTASAPGFTGTFVGNTTTGAITINGAAPVGNYTVTVTATDNCGATTTTTFTLAVVVPPTISKAISPSTIVPGATSTVTLNLSNANTINLTNASFSDMLTNMSAVGGAVSGTCVGTTPNTLSPGATNLSFSGITIPSSGSCTVTFGVTSSTLGTHPNTTSGVTTAQTPTAGNPSNTVSLVVTNTLNWNGMTSTDWHTASNWSPAFVPSATNDAVIPAAGVTNEPTISTSNAAVNTLNIAANRTLTIAAGRTLTVTGALTNSGLINVAGAITFGSLPTAGTFRFIGTAAQTIPAAVYNNLELNNNAGASLSGNAAVNGTLTLTNGDINTGVNKIIVGTAGSITRTSGHIIGDIEKFFGATGAFTYPVGTATGYSPVSVNVTLLNVNPSSLMVKANDGTAPANPPLNDAMTLDRFWTLTETGDLRANITFNYLESDVDGNEADYKTIRVEGLTAVAFPNFPPCPGGGTPCVDPAGNTIFVANVEQFSDWTAGELAPVAANVEVSGRVLTSEGRGVFNAEVTVTSFDGETITARTNPFGYFRFTEVGVGESYVFRAKHKQYEFMPQVITINEARDNIQIVAEP